MKFCTHCHKDTDPEHIFTMRMGNLVRLFCSLKCMSRWKAFNADQIDDPILYEEQESPEIDVVYGY